MSKTLGGCFFVYNGIIQDYCFIETMKCLSELCDKVHIIVIESEDGTMGEFIKESEPGFLKVTIEEIPIEKWNEQKGKEKLSYFQNEAIKKLDTDYVFLCQADEIIHESCFPAIRAAMETGHEGFYVSRINLWGDAYHYLHVEPSRMPVGSLIIRLAKAHYRSHDDGENILVNANRDFANEIRIYHMGFVRDPKKQVVKMKNMMENIFGWGLDSRQVGKDIFSPWDYFTPADVVPIRETLPKYIIQWAKEREHEFEKF